MQLQNTDLKFTVTITARILIFVLSVAFGTFVLLVSAKQVMAANLKDISIVRDDILKLEDIFDGLERNQDFVLGPSPQPGQDMVLNARTLYRIASALDLPWRPSTSNDQVTIRRAATVISFDRIEDTIKAGLRDNGLNADFNLLLSQGAKQIILPDDQPASLDIQSINYNPGSEYFEARLVAPSKSNPLRQVIYTGRVEQMTKVPVLKNVMRNGNLIRESDVHWISMRSRNVKPDMVMGVEDMVGMTPRRIVMNGKPVLSQDLESPKIVERGELVTLVFQNGPLQLTAKGKALQDGAKGDLIRVSNSNSNKTLIGNVSGPNEITIQ